MNIAFSGARSCLMNPATQFGDIQFRLSSPYRVASGLRQGVIVKNATGHLFQDCICIDGHALLAHHQWRVAVWKLFYSYKRQITSENFFGAIGLRGRINARESMPFPWSDGTGRVLRGD